MNYTKNFGYIISMVIAFATLLACNNSASEKIITEEHHDEEGNTIELTPTQYQTAGIELGMVEEKQISGTIKVNGVLDVPPQQLVSISVPLGGFLKHTELLQGSKVKKGQMIATIENLDFIQLQQDYLEAKSQYEFAKTDYERQQELAKENVNAQKTLQQAKSEYAGWQAKANGLKEKLKVLNINLTALEEGKITSTIYLYAPISGYVTEVNVNIGKFVNPTDVLFEIVDTEHLHAELIIFEKDVPKIKLGQKVRFTLANEIEERMATVYLIGREISTDRTIRIHCHIDEEDTDLLPGMYLKAIVETGGAKVTALPDEAIIDFQGKKYIFIKTEKVHGTEEGNHAEEETNPTESVHFVMMEVTIGHSEFGFTEVSLTDEWNPQNEVVIKGAYAILSKLKNSEEEGGHGH